MKVAGVEEAIILGELCSQYEYRNSRGELDEEGRFYCTVEDLEEKTTFSEYKQRKALKKLESFGLINSKVKGIPAKRFIKINEEQVLKIFVTADQNNSGDIPQKTQELRPEEFQTNNNRINNNTKNNNRNNKEKEKNKKKFGEFENVLLTEEEHSKLINRYGNETVDRYINKLDRWLEDGHKKKSHYLTIISWVEDDKDKEAMKNARRYNARNESGYNGFTPSTGVKTEPDF